MSSFSWVSPAVKISLASQFLYVLGMCLPPGIKQTACAGICIERSSWCTINAYLTWCVCQVTKVGFPGAITTSSVFLHVCPSLSLYIYIIFFFYSTTWLLHISSMFQAIQIGFLFTFPPSYTFLLLCINLWHSPGLSVPTLPINILYLVTSQIFLLLLLKDIYPRHLPT